MMGLAGCLIKLSMRKSFARNSNSQLLMLSKNQGKQNLMNNSLGIYQRQSKSSIQYNFQYAFLMMSSCSMLLYYSMSQKASQQQSFSSSSKASKK